MLGVVWVKNIFFGMEWPFHWILGGKAIPPKWWKGHSIGMAIPMP